MYSAIVDDEKITRFFKAENRMRKEDRGEKYLDDYPENVKINHMIVGEYRRVKRRVININCNTENELLKQIYIDFYNKYNVEGAANKELRRFFYYFSEVLRRFKIVKYEEINFEIIRKIYLELQRKKCNVEKNRMCNYVYILFRFLIEDKKYRWMNWNLKEAEKKAFRTKVIAKILREGFKPIYYTPIEKEFSSNKFCIIPNEYSLRSSDSANLKILFCDLEHISQVYIKAVKRYIWENEGNLRTKVHSLKEIYKFLEYICKDREYDITLEKAYMYRKILEGETQNLNGLKGKLKALRKFLKINKKYYKIDEKIFDIFSLKNLEKPKGGTIITDNDLKLIYGDFLRLEDKYENGRIYTIAFEICIYSNLRIGAILNLERDCLYKEDKKTYVNYFPKIGGKEKIRIPINEKIEKLILEAIEITDKYSKQQELANYIFIEEYLRIERGLKRIDFLKYFKKIIKSLNEKLDKKNYTVQNIRDTYMNTVCDEARKNDLSFNEIKAITNDSVKTIKKYYQQRNRIELIAESMFGIMINDVSCEGKILANEEKSKLKGAKDNLGKCSEDECVFDLAECLICKNFITFINRKNAFIEKIKECDRIIQETNNKFIKDERLYEKKLLTKYITEIMKLEQGESNELHHN
ncbi:hypothetical protein HMPREF1092_00613 [Clostridium thermobutyricum]|uniref:Uncharacterized protein n=1 Tax=Clostridium thermobutyricum TaxID=29372 RepID=N9WJX2_9CLOT|nr:hypothetical protein [Clostridium thermobutyricum]ENZ03426.1 hypothetical protein HMPREF1092_00613 [Clostridium thermobutyricum]